MIIAGIFGKCEYVLIVFIKLYMCYICIMFEDTKQARKEEKVFMSMSSFLQPTYVLSSPVVFGWLDS